MSLVIFLMPFLAAIIVIILKKFMNTESKSGFDISNNQDSKEIKINKLAIFSVICGFLSMLLDVTSTGFGLPIFIIILFIIPFAWLIALILPVLAIIFGSVALYKLKSTKFNERSILLAGVGILLGIIVLTFAIVTLSHFHMELKLNS